MCMVWAGMWLDEKVKGPMFVVLAWLFLDHRFEQVRLDTTLENTEHLINITAESLHYIKKYK